MLQQWLASLLLGALNIEQTKFLNWADLDFLLGTTTRSPSLQRTSLRALATPENLASLFQWNHRQIQQADPQPADTGTGTRTSTGTGTDFYLDPHTQHYTGMQAVLKGWCAAIRWADKLINSDYIHTTAGQPVYFECGDNFEDLRSRFLPFVERFHATMQWPPGQSRTYIIDRGIYGIDVFRQIIGRPDIHFITWEKGWQPAPWDPAAATGSSTLSRQRNDAGDLRHYQFSWRTEPWPTEEKILRIIVQATNPNGQTIQLSILSSHLNSHLNSRPVGEIIHLMFNRWIQENDFKYLDKHFGINQLTSYRSTPYSELRGSLSDRLVPNHLWQEKTKARKTLLKKYHRLLTAADEARRQEKTRQQRLEEIRHQLCAIPEGSPPALTDPAALTAPPPLTDTSPPAPEPPTDPAGESAKAPVSKHAQASLRKEQARHQEASKRHARYRQARQSRIEESHRQLEQNQNERDQLEQNISHLDQLQAGGKVRIDTAPKSLMDSLRLIARNQFYAALQPFKTQYDNYRDDHDYFRKLTQSSGLLRWNGTELEVHLTPRVNYQPGLKKILRSVLESCTRQELTLPDGSGRKLSFHLSGWDQFEITPRT